MTISTVAAVMIEYVSAVVITFFILVRRLAGAFSSSSEWSHCDKSFAQHEKIARHQPCAIVVFGALGETIKRC